MTLAVRHRHRAAPPPGRAADAGFTLLELLVVIAIIALASGVATLALRDPAASRLERESERLAALFEVARAQARALGVVVLWQVPARRLPGDMREPGDFSFTGLPASITLPERWLEAGEAPGVELPPGQDGILLGPEPVIGAQRLTLSLGQRRLSLATDGISPFRLADSQVPATGATGGSL